MDKKNDEIAHRRIVAGREIPRKYGQNNNSPATGKCLTFDSSDYFILPGASLIKGRARTRRIGRFLVYCWDARIASKDLIMSFMRSFFTKGVRKKRSTA